MNEREGVGAFQFEDSWTYENGFYLTSHITRIPKLLAHYELYKTIVGLPGAVIECGVFKGSSLIRFATFREVMESPFSRKIIGFDAFGKFPKVEDEHDARFIADFQAAAGTGLSVDELRDVLARKGILNVDLVKGDVRETVPSYLDNHPELRISLLHIDVDVYEPTVVILDCMFDRVVTGGLVVFDDYGAIPGETRAVDEFLNNANLPIEKLPISHIPSFVRIPA